MSMMHDPNVQASLKRRVQSLHVNSRPMWGRMTVDQMLWHVNESFRMALGDVAFQRMRGVPRLPRAIMRWMLLNVPWIKGRTPTYDEMRATATHDFAAEQARCLQLIDRMVAKSLDDAWPVNPTVGPMTGVHWSRLQAKHLEHHLKQFGV